MKNITPMQVGIAIDRAIQADRWDSDIAGGDFHLFWYISSPGLDGRELFIALSNTGDESEPTTVSIQEIETDQEPASEAVTTLVDPSAEVAAAIVAASVNLYRATGLI